MTGIIADLGIFGGEVKVEQLKACQSLISTATLKKWLDSLSASGEIAAAFAKGLAQGVANLDNGLFGDFHSTSRSISRYSGDPRRQAEPSR